MDIDGQVALVSGGASGAGEATARYLAELGADVAILDIDGQRASHVAADIGGYAQQCDMADAESVACGVTSAMARFGQAPRIVVSCAGIGLNAEIVGREGKVSIILFRRLMEVNLLGTYNLMSYAAQAMIDMPALDTGERGVIITTSTAQCHDGQAGFAAISAASSGIASMCLPAAREFSLHGIRVMSIAGGHKLSNDDSEQRQRSANQGSSDQLTQAQTYARLVNDIVLNADLTGSVIQLDSAAKKKV